MHAYRRRNSLLPFHDVDVNSHVEAEPAGQKVVRSVVLRAVNQVGAAAHRRDPRGAAPGRGWPAAVRGTMALLAIPGPQRRAIWRAVMGNPRWVKRFGGTVGLSAIGMFGSGGGWGIPIAPPTLMVTAGGISIQPRLIDGELRNREFLHVTLSFDHDVVDGAPAARFSRRLAGLVESAAGLAACDDGSRHAGHRSVG